MNRLSVAYNAAISVHREYYLVTVHDELDNQITETLETLASTQFAGFTLARSLFHIIRCNCG